MAASRSGSEERLRISSKRFSKLGAWFRGLSISSRLAPRPTLMAWYLRTLNCIRMLWNRASANSKTLARNSTPALDKATKKATEIKFDVSTLKPDPRKVAEAEKKIKGKKGSVPLSQN